MLRYKWDSLNKMNKNNSSFELHEIDSTNYEYMTFLDKGYGNIIKIDFSDEVRENMKEHLSVIVKAIKILHREKRKPLEFYLDSDFLKDNEELLAEIKRIAPSNIDNFLDRRTKVILTLKLCYCHIKNILKIPNGYYFYRGIFDLDNFYKEHPDIKVSSTLRIFIGPNTYKMDITLPNYLNKLKHIIDSVGNTELLCFSILYYIYYSDSILHLWHKKDVEKFLIPLPYKKLINNKLLMYQLINYTNLPNKIQHRG